MRHDVTEGLQVYEGHVMLDLKREAKEHVSSPHCWCLPRLEFVDPESGNEVWVHHEPH